LQPAHQDRQPTIDPIDVEGCDLHLSGTLVLANHRLNAF
jgi:hypothetical protein